MCEHGIESGTRSLLVSAKTIFQDLVAGATDYGVFYNLGNAFSGLGEYDDAREAYCEALKFNDKVAEVWKNLGTCYFHLRQHEKELECYDTALRLNPRLSHALASKANTTAVVFHDYEEALHLLEQALAADSEIGRNWPYFHWWKAHYLYELERFDEALRTVDGGLVHRPGEGKLLDLKARVLSAYWRRDANVRTAAATFYKFRLEANPVEVPSLIELAELCHADEALGDPFVYLARAFNTASKGEQYSPTELKVLANRERLMALAAHLRGYRAYRKLRPLEPFDDHGEIDSWRGFRYLWLVFGLAYTDVVQSSPSKESSVDEIVAFYQLVREALRGAIRTVATQVAREYQEADVQTKTEIMSLSLVKLGEVAFFESTWLFGYLPAANCVDQGAFAEANEQFIQQNDISPFRDDILQAALQPLNDAWNLFPREAPIEKQVLVMPWLIAPRQPSRMGW